MKARDELIEGCIQYLIWVIFDPTSFYRATPARRGTRRPSNPRERCCASTAQRSRRFANPKADAGVGQAPSRTSAAIARPGREGGSSGLPTGRRRSLMCRCEGDVEAPSCPPWSLARVGGALISEGEGSVSLNPDVGSPSLPKCDDATRSAARGRALSSVEAGWVLRSRFAECRGYSMMVRCTVRSRGDGRTGTAYPGPALRPAGPRDAPRERGCPRGVGRDRPGPRGTPSRAPRGVGHLSAPSSETFPGTDHAESRRSEIGARCARGAAPWLRFAAVVALDRVGFRRLSDQCLLDRRTRCRARAERRGPAEGPTQAVLTGDRAADGPQVVAATSSFSCAGSAAIPDRSRQASLPAVTNMVDGCSRARRRRGGRRTTNDVGAGQAGGGSRAGSEAVIVGPTARHRALDRAPRLPVAPGHGPVDPGDERDRPSAGPGRGIRPVVADPAIPEVAAVESGRRRPSSRCQAFGPRSGPEVAARLLVILREADRRIRRNRRSTPCSASPRRTRGASRRPFPCCRPRRGGNVPSC